MSAVQGKALGNFVVEAEIGRGGMGVVLRARQPLLDREVVLKKVRRDLAEQAHLCERFRREAHAAGAVHHPNVVTVYDYFTWRGDHYIAQEYVDGADLETVIARHGPLPWRPAALIALELVRGLEEIHAQGTVHRDLKPSNILIGRRGEVKIADFGIALEANGSRLTQPGSLVGTPPYMPPEQLRGERVDTRSDLFSLGAVWYELLAGVTPYPELKLEGTADEEACPANADGQQGVEPEADSTSNLAPVHPEPLLRRMEKERYTPLKRRAARVPRVVRRQVKRLLRAKPRRRYATARQLRAQLEALLGRPSPADLRSELALYLWNHGVFQAREGQTVVLAPAVAPVRERRALLGWLPTAAAAMLAGAILLVDTQPLSLWASLDQMQVALAASARDGIAAIRGEAAPESAEPVTSDEAAGSGAEVTPGSDPGDPPGEMLTSLRDLALGGPGVPGVLDSADPAD